MNSLATSLSVASAAADLARAASSPPEIARSTRTHASAVEIAGTSRGERAGDAMAAGIARASRRAAPFRALGRSTVAGYARAASARPAAKASTAKTSTAKSAGASASSSAGKSDPLAFLHDSKLSVEEKMMRLLEHLNERWEKDMQKKLDEMAGHKAASPSSAKASGAPSKSSSFLGKIVDGAKKFFPEVGLALDALKNPAVRSVATKIGGPVLAAAATALGFPALAPALLKYAPTVIDLAAGAASALDSGGAGAAEAAKSSGSSSSASQAGESSGGLSDNQMKLKLMEVQRIQDAQKEMFSMVSNLLRSSHELRMSLIGNLR